MERILSADNTEQAGQVHRRQSLFGGGRVVVFQWSTENGWPILSVSPNVDQFGFNAEDLVREGQRFAELIHPEDLSRIVENEVGTFEQDYRILCPNGEIRWIYDYTVEKRDPQGKVEYLEGYILDITERKKAEAALQENVEMFQTITNNLFDLICLTDDRLRIRFASPSYAKVLGYNAEDLIGQWTFQGVHPEDLPELLTQVHGAICSKSEGRFQYRYRHSSGGYRWLETIGSILFENEEKLKGAVLVSRDITEKKLADEQLAQQAIKLADALEKVQTATKVKSEFMATMSHEIRTPMNGIMGMTDLLLETELNEEQLDYARILGESSKSLMSIINDILDFSKIEGDKTSLEMIEFDLPGSVSEIVRKFSPKCQEKGIILKADIENRTPRWVLGDPTRLQQILVHVLGNAVKFTDTGGIQVNVSPQFHSGGKTQVCFMITDTGIGIAVEKQSAIFQAFYQGDNSTTRKYGGTGLGLSIAKKLVQLMGGEIGFTSEEGVGSNFWFVIPFALGAAKEVFPIAEGIVESQRDLLVQSPRPVLLVEDNPVNVKLTSALIQKFGLNVEWVNNGKEAIAAVEKGDYSLILMDCQMPVMDGFTAARAIRQIPGKAGIPIIALTAYAMEGDREKCLAAGMDDYLTKPVGKEELLRVLVHWLGRNEPEMKSDDLDTSWEEVLDLSVLKEIALLDDENPNELVEELIQMFLTNSVELVSQLKIGLKQEDSPAVQFAAHSLKSSSYNVGAKTLAELCLELELLARKGTVQGGEEIFLRFSVEYQRVCQSLQALLDRGLREIIPL